MSSHWPSVNGCLPPAVLRFYPIACGLVILGMISSTVHGDIFLLVGGGQIEGDLVNLDETPRRSYVVKTIGGTITVPSRQVKKVLSKSSNRQRYDSLRLRMPDTADGHWKMSEWCREHHLADLRQLHLNQVIRHEPDHETARRGLGFTRIDGNWVRTKEWNEKRGYVNRNGSWRVAQDIELTKQRDESDQSQKKWIRQLKTWRNWIGGRRDAEARDNLRAVRDPLAAKGLVELLEKEQESNLKLIYVRLLGGLNSALAVEALVKTSLEDSQENIRDACLVELKRHGSPQAVRYFIGQLESKHNGRVNRAAVALGQLGDFTAVLPLIEALETEHKLVIRRGNPGAINPVFGQGSGGLSVGGGPKVVKERVQNAPVLGALLAITDGINFRFDQRAWKGWYADQQAPANFNLRRDE